MTTNIVNFPGASLRAPEVRGVDVVARGDAPSITVQDEIEGVTETVFRVIADSGNTTFQTGTTMATLSNAVTLDPAGGVLEVHGDVRSNVVRANTVTVDTLDITGEMELELLKVRGHVAEIGSNNTADTSTDTGLILTTRTKHWPSNATATFTYANYASTVDTIGFSVDLNDDGDRMIVGNANDVGKVFIYHKQNGVWTNTPTAVFNEVDSSEYFGICVAMNGAGTRAFVGARGNDDGGSNRGKIYVFDYTGASWNSTATVELPGQSDTEQMGWTIRSNRAGTRIVTGGRFNDESGTNLGRVYVFEYSNGSWNTTPTDFEAPSGGSQFGVSVAINAEGTRIAAISYYHVRVYDYVSGSWQTTPTFEDYTGGTESASCSMNAAGDVIAVSRISNYTKVYHLTGSTWELRTTLFTGEELTTNISCSMNDAGDRLAIGNRRTSTDNLDEAGSVYVFDYVNGAWNSNPTAIIYGSVANAHFAGAFNSVALNASGDAFAVGAYANDQEGTDVGRVYVYEQSGESNVAIAYDGNDTLHVGYTSNTAQDGAFLVDTSKNFKTKVAGEFHVSRNINVGYSAEQKESIGILLDAKEKFWEKTTTLTGGGIEFGYHLDISNDGNRLIVCDRANDTANVYHRTSEGGWGVDPVKTYSSADFICVGISGDGNRIAVGGDTGDLVEVYDYDASTETWGSTSAVSFTGTASSRFGRRFAMNYDGTVFVIGAHKDDTSGTNDGRAYIKEYINGSWVTTELASPVSSSTEANFGLHCDINDEGDRVLVVAAGTDVPGTNSGSFHVYHKENGVWSEVFTYEANSTDLNPSSARINRTGDKIIYCSFQSTLIATDVGRAYLYSYVNGSWTYETDFLPGTTGVSGFGIACDISDKGDRAFIGALYEKSMDNTDYQGAVYIFDKINGKWNKNPTRVILETPVRETLTEWDSLRCDISGEILAIGGGDQPNVYVYELTPKNSSVAIVYDGNNTLDIGYTSSEPGSKNIKIDTAKPLNLRINGSLHSHARYDLLRRLVSVTSDSANGIMKVEPYAPIFINESQDDWETYVNVPYYLLGAAGTNTVNNDSNITVTLKCTMTAFLIRKEGWSDVSTTNWSIMDGSGDIISNTSSHDEMRIYIRTLGAGDHSLDTTSALYAFIL